MMYGFHAVFRWLLGCNSSKHGVAKVSPEQEEFSLLYFHIWIPVHLPDSETMKDVGGVSSCVGSSSLCFWTR